MENELKFAHVYQKDIAQSSRVQRHCEALAKEDYSSDVFYFGGINGPSVTKTIGKRSEAHLLTKRNIQNANLISKVIGTLRWGRDIGSMIRTLRPSVISCHSLALLPLSVRLKRALKCPLVYEPHELETRTMVSTGLRRIVSETYEKFLIRNCDGIIVVSESIANWYKNNYCIQRPEVVRNIPEIYPNTKGQPERSLREKFGVPDDELIFIYQGYLEPGRRVEQYLRVFSELGRPFNVVFMGRGSLVEKITEASKGYQNIFYHRAVLPQEILLVTRGADVGLCGVENRCLSYYFSLPNKLFEFLAAGIPCLAPSFPDIRSFVDEFDCGWIHEESDADLKLKLCSINEGDIRDKSMNSVRSKNKVSWEIERKILVAAYKKVICKI